MMGSPAKYLNQLQSQAPLCGVILWTIYPWPALFNIIMLMNLGEGFTISLVRVIGKMPMFSALESTELQKIADISMLRAYKGKSNVFLEGEERHSVYFINKGLVKIYKLDAQGNECIVAFLKEGEMFPHAGFFEKTPYPGTAEIVAESELCVIPVQAFEKIMIADAEIAMKVMRVMGQKIRELQAKVQELSNNDVNQRLCALVLRLAEGYGEQTASGIYVNLPLTHSDLAKMVGTTRETVNRFLNKLKKEGVLETPSKGLLLMDQHALEQMLLEK